MLRQSIKGLRPLTVSLACSDADEKKLSDLMAGKTETFKNVGSGGVALPAIPNPLNKKTFIVKKRNADGSHKSTQFSIPHVKPSSTAVEIFTMVKGKFTCSYDVGDTIACDNVKLTFDA